MKYKTSEISGAMLDAAVAKALGMSCRIQHYSKEQWDGIQQPFDGDACIVSCMLFQPSTSWAQGGTIIESNDFLLPYRTQGHRKHMGEYSAQTPGGFEYSGPTPLIAAMRAYVAAKLSDEVEL